jgi:hypothetical protein
LSQVSLVFASATVKQEVANQLERRGGQNGMNRILVFASVLCLVLLGSGAFAQNVLVNPGFEDGTGTPPPPWLKVGTYELAVEDGTVNPDRVHSGTKSVSITNPVGGVFPGFVGVRQRDMVLDRTGTKKYRIKAWIKKTTDISVVLRWSLTEFSPEFPNTVIGGAVATPGATPSGTSPSGWGPVNSDPAGDWVQIANGPDPILFGGWTKGIWLTIYVFPNATSGTNTGTVYLDDVELTAEPSGTIYNTVSGTATLSGASQAGVIVGVKPATNAAADAYVYAKTDAAGNWGPVYVPDGTYYAAAWKQGYEPTADSAPMVLAGGGSAVVPNLNVSMRSGRNVAIGCLVAATDVVGGYEAEKSVDGLMTSRWSSPGAGPDDVTYTMDLGTAQNVTGVTFFWNDPRPDAYTIETTLDDPFFLPAWSPLYSATNSRGGCLLSVASGFNAGSPIRLNPPVAARGLRFHFTQRFLFAYSPWEIEVHNDVYPGTVSGTVRYPGGDPVPGAVVGLKGTPMATADADAYLLTDATGQYSFNVYSGTEYNVAAWKEGWMTTLDTHFTAVAGNFPADLTLPKVAGKNLSIAADVYASDGQDFARNSADGNHDSRWWGFGATWETEVTYMLDLHALKNLSEIDIDWNSVNTPKDWAVDVCTTDPTYLPAWNEVYSIVNTTDGYRKDPNHTLQMLRFQSTVQAWGVRFRFARDFNHWNAYSPFELEVRSADEFSGLVHGKVTGSGPIEGALVHLGPATTDPVLATQVYTDSTGYYSIPWPAGDQILTADAWQFKNQDVVVTLLGDGTPTTKNFTLTAQAETTLAPNWNMEETDPIDPTLPKDWIPYEQVPPMTGTFTQSAVSPPGNHTPGGTYYARYEGPYAGEEAGWQSTDIPVVSDGSRAYNMWFYRASGGTWYTDNNFHRIIWVDAGHNIVGYSGDYFGDNQIWNDDWTWRRTAAVGVVYRRVPPGNAAYMRIIIGKWAGSELYTALDDVIVEQITAPSVAEAKQMEDGSPVSLMNKKCTASSPVRRAPLADPLGGVPVNTAYICDKDTGTGIRVDTTVVGPDPWFGVGDDLNVDGIIATVGGEKTVIASGVGWSRDGRSPSVVGMNNRDVTTPLAQGRLIKTWGSVQSVGANSFVMTDGAGDPLTVQCGDLTKPSVGEFVKVRGIAGVGGTLMPRFQVDIALGTADTGIPLLGPVACVRDCLMIGPFTADVDQATALATDYLGGEAAIQPDAGDVSGGKTWFIDREDEIKDFNVIFGNPPADPGIPRCSTSYMASWIWSPTTQLVDFGTGSDDGFNVWLNGTLVDTQVLDRAYLAYHQNVYHNTTLNAGWNLVLLKVVKAANAGFGGMIQFGVNNTFLPQGSRPDDWGWGDGTPLPAGIGFSASKP